MTSHAHCVSIFWAEMPREGASLGAQTLLDNCQFLQAEKMLGSVSPREVLPAGSELINHKGTENFKLRLLRF